MVGKAQITPLCSMTNENHPLMLCVYTRSSLNLLVPEPCVSHRLTGVQGLEELSPPNGGCKDKSTVVGNYVYPVLLVSAMLEMLDLISKKENNVQISKVWAKDKFCIMKCKRRKKLLWNSTPNCKCYSHSLIAAQL